MQDMRAFKVKYLLGQDLSGLSVRILNRVYFPGTWKIKCSIMDVEWPFPVAYSSIQSLMFYIADMLLS